LFQLNVATTAAPIGGGRGGGEGRKRFFCPLCHISVIRLALHLQMKHKLTPGSEEIRRHVEESRNIREEDVTVVSTLQDLLILYQKFLTSFSGGQKASTVADPESRVTATFRRLMFEGQATPTKGGTGRFLF
jgi:hypothetical protein